jgi:flagellar hook-basal body complex protein FliE
MDGLTISNSDGLIQRGSTLSELRNSKFAIPNPAASEEAKGTSFADTLKAAVTNVNQMQKESDTKMQELAVGKSNNIHDVMLTAERADIALRLMMQVRNKIIEAYQEVMKMQV